MKNDNRLLLVSLACVCLRQSDKVLAKAERSPRWGRVQRAQLAAARGVGRVTLRTLASLAKREDLALGYDPLAAKPGEFAPSEQE
jgi:hypothetical protein